MAQNPAGGIISRRFYSSMAAVGANNRVRSYDPERLFLEAQYMSLLPALEVPGYGAWEHSKNPTFPIVHGRSLTIDRN
jgi:hypothetical protein